MYLNRFFDYKNQLMEDLITNPEIVRLLSDDTKSVDNPKSLIYKQVFPFEYIPETVEHGHTFICFDVDIQKTMNKTYMQPTIYVWVFTHKSKLRLPEGGVRIDKLVTEISKQLNGSREYTLGELDLYSVKRFAPLSNFQGKVITFQGGEMNRPAPTYKTVPIKRGGK